jgi:hypothetical protein
MWLLRTRGESEGGHGRVGKSFESIYSVRDELRVEAKFLWAACDGGYGEIYRFNRSGLDPVAPGLGWLVFVVILIQFQAYISKSILPFEI